MHKTAHRRACLLQNIQAAKNSDDDNAKPTIQACRGLEWLQSALDLPPQPSLCKIVPNPRPQSLHLQVQDFGRLDALGRCKGWPGGEERWRQGVPWLLPLALLGGWTGDVFLSF